MRTIYEVPVPADEEKPTLKAALAAYKSTVLMATYKERAKAKSSQSICPGCEESSEGRSTSKAHSCVARKTLELAFRYGLAEFYAAPALAARDRDQIVADSIDLNGTYTGAAMKQVNRKSLTESLDRLDQRYATALHAKLSQAQQAALARELSDTIQQDLDTVLASDDLPAEYRRAFVSALCTAYRDLVLRIVRTQAPRQADKFLGLIVEIVAVGPAPDPVVCNVAHAFASLKTNINSDGAAITWIDINGLDWATQSQVEFGKQCGICENAQGDEDLSRRLIDYMIEKSLRPNAQIPPQTRYGKLYADLYPGSTGNRPTVWDLSNAVTCTAIGVFLEEAIAKNKGAQPGVYLKDEFGRDLLKLLNAMPHLFIAYMEILMLDLAHTEPFQKGESKRRLVKTLLAPNAKPPVQERPKEPEDDGTIDFDLFG